MRDLRELNLNEGGGPVRHKPPTPEIVSAFEVEFGWPLPTDYLTFLNFANGGHPEADTFIPQGLDSRHAYGVDHFLHLSADRTNVGSIWWVLRAIRPIIGKHFLPFAETGGGDPFLLDFTASPPTVAFCSHEFDFAVRQIAPSFEAFIDGLHIDPEDM